ncbi:MAG: hypothetical protein AVDCRST_MAG65-1832, partial [uncultured Solirubrobacteraceae bacterium]
EARVRSNRARARRRRDRPRRGRLLRPGRELRLRTREVRGLGTNRRAWHPVGGARGARGLPRPRGRLLVPLPDGPCDRAPGAPPRRGPAQGDGRRGAAV